MKHCSSYLSFVFDELIIDVFDTIEEDIISVDDGINADVVSSINGT
jgi:hypothetical protein